MAFHINTRYRKTIKEVHNNQDKVIWSASDTEMENHADNHCFGANFRLIPFTMEE